MKRAKRLLVAYFLLYGSLQWLSLIENNIPVLNDIGSPLFQIDITDFFMKHDLEEGASSQIVLINVGTKDVGREKIGLLLTEIAKLSPSAVGIDFVFNDYSKGSHADSVLLKGITSNSNITLYSDCDSAFLKNCKPSFYFRFSKTWMERLTDPFIGNSDENSRIRYFKKYSIQGVEKDTINDISYQLLKWHDNQLYHEMVKNVDHRSAPSLIKYTGSISSGRFKKYEITDILNGNIKKSDIQDKIVIVGFLGGSSYEYENEEGRQYSPLNPNLINKKTDLYSSEIIANIIDMALLRKRLHGVNVILHYVLNDIFVILSILLIDVLTVKNIAHFKVRILIYSFIALLFFLTMLSFFVFNFKLNINISILFIPLVVELYPKYLKVYDRYFS